MQRLAEEMCIVKLIHLHNRGERDLDLHEHVCCGSQFSLGVSFMCHTTLHFLMNMARAKSCCWQLQGHFDGSFIFCEKSIAMLGFGMGSLDAHFNPVCFAITNGETAEAYEWTYRLLQSRHPILVRSIRSDQALRGPRLWARALYADQGAR